MAIAGPPRDERRTVVLGDLNKAIEDPTLPRPDRLIAAAQLHHAFSFDEVSECDIRLDNEPRCSVSCAECHAFWIGSKAGEIIRIEASTHGLAHCKIVVAGGVRALVHIHDRGQLIAGIDLGHLIALDATTLATTGVCHLTKSLAAAPTAARYEPDRELEDSEGSKRFLYGVTALHELPRDVREPDIVHLVVATRSPELFVVVVEHRSLTIRARHAAPGWIRCIALTGAGGDERLVCGTRGGDLLEWSCRTLREAPHTTPSVSKQSGVLAIALAAASQPVHRNQHALLIGTGDGLYIRRSEIAQPVHVAITRSAVLTITTVELPPRPGTKQPSTGDEIAEGAPGVARHYVALGLADGRLRVVEERALFAWLDGNDEPRAHDFRVAMGDAIGALQVLESDEPSARFVLAGLRDHRLRLFCVRSSEQLSETLRQLFADEIGRPIIGSGSETRLTTLLTRERKLRDDASEHGKHALSYLLVDQVLPSWTSTLGRSQHALVAHACDITKDADDKTLYRLAATMGRIADKDAEALIRLSMAGLNAMPLRDRDRRRAYMSYHLKRFHACARQFTGRDDVARLQYWGRFVRKYMFLGDAFTAKRFGIQQLIERNKDARKHLDALIFAAQLERQRYDLMWSAVCEDDNHRRQEIMRVDLIGDHAIVVTASAEVIFFTAKGERLLIYENGNRIDHLVPVDNQSRSLRARATRSIRKQPREGDEGPRVHIALSWAKLGLAPRSSPRGNDQRPRGVHTNLAIFDVQFVAGQVRLEHRFRLRDEHNEIAARDGSEIEAHGIIGLPGSDAFLIGLDSSERPLALLRPIQTEGGQDWALREIVMARQGSQDALPSAVSTPVRTVAALELSPGLYLGAAGAADGALRFVAFDLDGHVTAVDANPTLLVYPINDIALAERRGDPEFQQLCYAGVDSGVSLCLRVKLAPAAAGEPPGSPQQIVVKPRWRDVHNAGVIAVRPTRRPEPSDSHDPDDTLLYDDDVVFVATKDGHISIYRAEHGSPTSLKISERDNFHFEGIRYDRLDLPKGMISWAIRRSRSGFLAAYPNGELVFGQLHAPRQSTQYVRMKQDTSQIYERVSQERLLFRESTTPAADKLAICSMIRVGGGALRNYVLRKRLEELPWDSYDASEIVKLLEDQLRGLDENDVEDRDRIKIIIETVSKRVLDRPLTALLEDYRLDRAIDRVTEYQRVLPVCRFLANYLLDAMHGRAGALRVRMTIAHELFRVHVMWLVAIDRQSGHQLLNPLREVLTACLRDDDRVVRVETLRALAVSLRNIGVLLARAGRDDTTHEMREGFFPLGLSTLQWLLDTVLANFARYRGHNEPLPVSTPWSYITVLVAVIRLFPNDALGVCEQLSRWGLGDSIEVILERLTGNRVAAVRTRIRDLWLVPELRLPTQIEQRAAFIKQFEECKISDALAAHRIGPQDPDHPRASGLLHIYRRLAVLWNVLRERDIDQITTRWGRIGEPTRLIGSLVGMEQVLNGFLDIVRDRRDARADRLAALRLMAADTLRDERKPPEAVRISLDRVFEHWQAVVAPRPRTTGDRIGIRKLGRRLLDRADGIIHTVEGWPSLMAKVQRDPDAWQDFYVDARVSRELAERYRESFLTTEVRGPSEGYMVLEHCRTAAAVADAYVDPGERPRLALLAAQQLARALQCLHAENLVHGALTADHVWVGRDAPVFKLGDLHALPTTHELLALSPEVPECLRHAARRKRVPAQWLDVASLALFLYWLRSGQQVRPNADQHAIDEIVAGLRRDHSDSLARAIAAVLGGDPDDQCETARSLEHRVASPPLDFIRRPLGGRPHALYDVFISYDSRNYVVSSGLLDHLRARGYNPYLDSREPVDLNWAESIRPAIENSRAFAILLGSEYRAERGGQNAEVTVARRVSSEHQLPFLVFQIADTLPRESLPRDLRGIAAIEVPNGNPAVIAEHIIHALEHAGESGAP